LRGMLFIGKPMVIGGFGIHYYLGMKKQHYKYARYYTNSPATTPRPATPPPTASTLSTISSQESIGAFYDSMKKRPRGPSEAMVALKAKNDQALEEEMSAFLDKRFKRVAYDQNDFEDWVDEPRKIETPKAKVETKSPPPPPQLQQADLADVSLLCLCCIEVTDSIHKLFR
jgi:hypothetical protein